MSTNLRNIRDFRTLVRYLEDELGWPLEGYEVEDLTFEYEPDELGLKPEEAAKVKSIRQLRPLTSQQPWGIFFIEFDKKKLPVVVLRRILSHLVVKKRASANKADRAAWRAEDLLFISAFGSKDAGGREIGFAHFHQADEDLPSLRVLGWDGGDTTLKLEHVAHTLSDRLRWPQQGEKLDYWRERWAGAFRHRVGHVITTADMLAEAMAELAKRIRNAASLLMEHETERGPLRKLHRAFQTNLIHDLTEEGFADTYAQTITYGLLTAAISRTEMSAGPEGTVLHAGNIVDMVPVTNPFLKEMLQTFLKVGGHKGGMDFDELGVQDVVELLRGKETDLPAILRDFGNKTQGEDPVIHFYEHFLTAYNKKLKIQRGVFYTPQAVVGYIVRSVHELLQTEFGLEDGLADTTTWGEMIERHKRAASANPQSEIRNPKLSLPPLTDEHEEKRTISPDEPFVQILDPATGTATFLVEVIEVIHRTMVAKWKRQRLNEAQQRAAWNEYVPKHLLPRMHAYELMMAPYAIAHMKIGLKLAETGYVFATEERVRIYLTNALEPWMKQLPLIGFDALAHEAAAVNEVKRHTRFTVVIGNPPYSNFGQLNKIPFILGLLDDYKRGLGEKKLNLDDDFIKFVRFSQHLLDMAGVGVIGMITNNVFIDGITHRRFRESLKTSFGDVRILDLHGSSKKLEASPDGAKEENVFDIQQGVGISLLTKSPSGRSAMIRHSELWGAREAKYRALQAMSACRQGWTTIGCAPPHFFFVPKSFGGLEEYQSLPSIAGDVFSERNAGVQTKRDGLIYSFTKEELEVRLADIRSLSGPELTAKYKLPDDGRDWTVEWARQDVRRGDGHVVRIAYHPFDSRWTYFTGRTKGFMAYPRTPLMWSALQPNKLLLAVRNPRRGNVDSFFVGETVVDKDSVSPFDNVTFFPLYTYPDPRTSQRTFELHGERRINLTTAFLHSLSAKLRLPAQEIHSLPLGLTPEDIFHYAYAVFHSPGYRSRYAEFLKIDFPRLPLTGKIELFRSLARLGGELVALHLMESPALEDSSAEYVGGSNLEVEKISWSNDTVWINKAASAGFKGVPEAVWNFHIGGYQVCEKWLKDRKGRTLSAEDIAHYRKIVKALSETLRLMKEIDEVIEEHGGWPAAFAATATDPATADANEPALEPAVPTTKPTQTPPPKPSAAWIPGELFTTEGELAPAKKAPAAPEAAPRFSSDLDKNDWMARVRKIMAAQGTCDRPTFAEHCADALGHQRMSKALKDAVDNAIRTAKRRGFLIEAAGVLSLERGTLEEWDRDFLKDQFMAALNQHGRMWTLRDDAVHAFGQWFGFRRMGAVIDKLARSLINGLLRDKRLEKDSQQRIRRA